MLGLWLNNNYNVGFQLQYQGFQPKHIKHISDIQWVQILNPTWNLEKPSKTLLFFKNPTKTLHYLIKALSFIKKLTKILFLPKLHLRKTKQCVQILNPTWNLQRTCKNPTIKKNLPQILKNSAELAKAALENFSSHLGERFCTLFWFKGKASATINKQQKLPWNW